ncbi:MAG: hypothetical protein FJ403_19585 [Verrucomicrobia bacterium]|nr:hypothetical protein [Verrucomicrobiota bacterium]
MALPFTDPTPGDSPTGDQSWTCFLSAANFKGPIAFYTGRGHRLSFSRTGSEALWGLRLPKPQEAGGDPDDF